MGIYRCFDFKIAIVMNSYPIFRLNAFDYSNIPILIRSVHPYP